MNSLLIPGSVGLLTTLAAKKFFKSGYHDLGFVCVLGACVTGYFMVYDYRRRSSKDYKTQLASGRRAAYKNMKNREITRYLQKIITEQGSLAMLKNPMMNQQMLMQVIQQGEFKLQQGDKLGAISQFSIAACLSYMTGGEEKGRKLIETISSMLPDLREPLEKSYQQDMKAVDEFLDEIGQGKEQPKVMSREEFVKKLQGTGGFSAKPVTQTAPVVEEVLDEDSIDEDSADEADDAVVEDTVIEETVVVDDIVEELNTVNEPVQEPVQSENNDLESEKYYSNSFSTPEVLSGTDFNQSDDEQIEEQIEEAELSDTTVPVEVIVEPTTASSTEEIVEEIVESAPVEHAPIEPAVVELAPVEPTPVAESPEPDEIIMQPADEPAAPVITKIQTDIPIVAEPEDITIVAPPAVVEEEETVPAEVADEVVLMHQSVPVESQAGDATANPVKVETEVKSDLVMEDEELE